MNKQEATAMSPHQRVRYPADADVILDVTKPPYGADNTGQTDCTDILIRVLDDVLRPNIEGMKRAMAALEAATEDFVMEGSFENRRENGRLCGIFPDKVSPSRIVYFPKGTYLVSNTIRYSFENLKNGAGSELNRFIRIQGEDCEQTVIKLVDNCPGFEYGNIKPVVSFMAGGSSNVAMGNYFRNLTVDIGSDNPGAVALDFFCNNTGAVRDVCLRSSDPLRRGVAGLAVLHGSISCAVFKNIEVEGFDVGIQLGGTSGSSARDYAFMENLVLRDQRRCGVGLQDAVTVLRNLHSTNKAPAVSVNGNIGHVHILDADLKGGGATGPAIVHSMGVLFLRNISSEGYGCAVSSVGHASDEFALVAGPHVDEYSSHGVQCLGEEHGTQQSLNLPIEDSSPDWIADSDEWVHPKQFGAVADGVHDDSDAIQAALDSGKSVLYFQPGEYVINRALRVPRSIKRINGMFVELVAGPELKEMKDVGAFTVDEDSEAPLVIEDILGFERFYGHQYLVDHASRRTLVIRDVHLQSCSAYRNSVSGGRVFLENIFATNGIFCDKYLRPCFVFKGQQVWARQLDPEYSLEKIVNEGSELVLLGYKTEGHGVNFSTRRGKSEILSGVLLFGGNDETPCVRNEDSDVAFSGVTYGSEKNHHYPWPIEEISHGVASRLPASTFPLRYRNQFTIPLYVGRLLNARAIRV